MLNRKTGYEERNIYLLLTFYLMKSYAGSVIPSYNLSFTKCLFTSNHELCCILWERGGGAV